MVYFRVCPQPEDEAQLSMTVPLDGKHILELRACASVPPRGHCVADHQTVTARRDFVAPCGSCPADATLPPSLSRAKWTLLLSYLWSIPFFYYKGQREADGQKVFAEKHCDSCHTTVRVQSSAAGLTNDDYAMIAVPGTWAGDVGREEDEPPGRASVPIDIRTGRLPEFDQYNPTWAANIGTSPP